MGTETCVTKEGITYFGYTNTNDFKNGLQFRPACKFMRCLTLAKSLCKNFNVGHENMVQQFCKTTAVKTNMETVISFWMFYKSEENRDDVINFFNYILKPRIYAYAVTRDQCLEGMLVVNLQNLTVENFQKWFENTLTCLQVSADCLTIPMYMSAQMTTCLDRILNGKFVTSNVRANKDFNMLFCKYFTSRTDENQVFLSSGMQFTTSNFLHLKSQLDKMSRQQERHFEEEKKKKRANLEVGNIILALHRTKCMNIDTKLEILRLLELEETCVAVNANETNASRMQAQILRHVHSHLTRH